MNLDPDKLKEALEDMCGQFSFWSERDGGGYWTGGLSVLEDAFDALGWTDPMPAPDARCQFPKCQGRATCGTPTKDGYKRLCSEHYAATTRKEGE